LHKKELKKRKKPTVDIPTLRDYLYAESRIRTPRLKTDEDLSRLKARNDILSR
jgi:hypothetical protein